MKSKKLLMITQNFYPELGSAANRMKMLFKHFTQEGVVTHVLTTEPSYPNHELYQNQYYFDDDMINRYENESIVRMKMLCEKQNKNLLARLMYYVEQYIRVRHYIYKHKNDYDYIYVTSPNIFIAWATLFMKKAKRPTYILEVRDLWPDSVNGIKGVNLKLTWPLLKRLEKLMYQRADKIVINNKGFQEHIQRMLSKDKQIQYIPNSVSEEERFTEEKFNAFHVIYTGNIGYAQDVEHLIELFEGLNDNQVYSTAIVYGVKAPKFRQAVQHLEYVTLKPVMSREQCLKEISKHHIALSILNDDEIFLNVLPGKIVDAIGVNTLPVTNIGGKMAEDINMFQIGFAEKNATPKVLLEKILKYRDHPSYFETQLKNARQYRDQFLNWEKNIKTLMSFLKG
ncbi:glycosyltransferase family 4 protein [Staphylococcus intermedius]|uniref:Glycoside hydrolase n=1 Tax=Staphylococcus intermedius NCTC 11048 TaxID=1141106 RepID=A0A380G9U5_STAIN|nr:glycosyltransferase family 4 protein [Staphylococcus intermedius]PCF65263.1 glycosyltransferase WbuB [Staphylococcus intermedius]PCF80874.1 glycosyltransferase WbuB [Staphylococcus intermedius]PCF82223.1 glycosyltransferase WbuB [Staphylococcus intermedius]PCF87485.1 glycosyltransferase WbuB [Staphylococcus intermedius]PCF88559.1 glycosyltransferase WbuB [Staphylococcus intermedius]